MKRTTALAIGAAIGAALGLAAGTKAGWWASRINTEKRCLEDANKQIMELERMHEGRLLEAARERRDLVRRASDLEDENRRLRDQNSGSTRDGHPARDRDGRPSSADPGQ